MAQGKRAIALALAGGNALGAYGAGAYQALHEHGYAPDIISGASIGAVTGGIIAGNVPAQRIDKLREFWRQAGVGSAYGLAPPAGKSREMYNLMHALQTLVMGRPGLFKPRVPGLISVLPGMPPDVALFDSKPLVSTLRRVIDFDVLNAAEVPLVIGTVDMQNGEAVFFDTRREKLEPLHFLATTAFTPGFPPVEIEGRLLADPGLISNLPIDAVLDPPPPQDLLCFAVDLFDANGARPYSLDTGLERAQDIIFSTQALRALDARTREHRLRHMIHELSGHIPSEQRGGRTAELAAEGRANEITVVLVAYRAPAHELSAKTVDFSRASIDERWAVGLQDMNAALDKLESGSATSAVDGYTFYDARSGRTQA
ncbi:MAG TPA: patatin-like phospholipase family protein [Burkholderiales bacterium]|nr:patatin-like phospholipase family protein [Burkholderiales bacterium]